MKPTCYHLRRVSDGQKLVGGTVPRSCSTLDQSAEWLANHAQVAVSGSGQVNFLYGGTYVRAYLSVDPAETVQGQEALTQWRIDKRNREDAEAERNADFEREIEDLMDGLSYEEIVSRLRGES